MQSKQYPLSRNKSTSDLLLRLGFLDHLQVQSAALGIRSRRGRHWLNQVGITMMGRCNKQYIQIMLSFSHNLTTL